MKRASCFPCLIRLLKKCGTTLHVMKSRPNPPRFLHLHVAECHATIVFHQPVGLWWLFVGFSLLLSGCQRALETQYADARGSSINGVNTFVDLIKSSGRRADVWTAITPRMKADYGTIVIFVSHFDHLPEEATEHISQLLWEDSLKTVLIVVRDGDCAIDYWRQIAAIPGLSSTEIAEAARARDSASSELTTRATSEFDADEGGWYGLKRVSRATDPLVRSVQISSDGAPVTISARWSLNRRLEPAENAEILWQSQDDPLLTREQTHTGQVLVLASATPVSNGGLVDPGNRQLAETLIHLLPANERTAVVISSRWSGGKSAESPGLWQFLIVHPHGWIFGQTLFAIIIFCWWKLPIFGRPRTALNSELVRFGRHVEALGTLLRRTRDANFARQAIRNWQRGEKSRSGPNRGANVMPKAESLEETS